MLCSGTNSSIKADDLSDLDLEDINLSLSTHNTEARDDFATHDDETPVHTSDENQLSKQVVDFDCQLNRTQEQEDDHGKTEFTGDEATVSRKQDKQQEKQCDEDAASDNKTLAEKRYVGR